MIAQSTTAQAETFEGGGVTVTLLPNGDFRVEIMTDRGGHAVSLHLRDHRVIDLFKLTLAIGAAAQQRGGGHVVDAGLFRFDPVRLTMFVGNHSRGLSRSEVADLSRMLGDLSSRIIQRSTAI